MTAMPEEPPLVEDDVAVDDRVPGDLRPPLHFMINGPPAPACARRPVTDGAR